MNKLKAHIHDESNGLDYTLVGDYYIPDFAIPESTYSIGRWGRQYRDYLRDYHPIRYGQLVLSGELFSHLANLNEQTEVRLALIIEQMKSAEGITEAMKAADQMAWVGAMNNIRNRAEEIILHEFIHTEEAR